MNFRVKFISIDNKRHQFSFKHKWQAIRCFYEMLRAKCKQVKIFENEKLIKWGNN